MNNRFNRLQTIKALISRHELSCQDEVLKALEKEGIKVTQATLSRDMKQLKVVKVANMDGKYFYVLPHETKYKRVSSTKKTPKLTLSTGFVSINFAGNMGVIKTQPGYASSIAYNIDNSGAQSIIGTIAGDDTIFIVVKDGVTYDAVTTELAAVIPDIK